MSGIELALILVFLLMSAFFSSSESAYLSLQKTRIAHLVSTGRPGAAKVSRMINRPERMLSTVLLGNNLVNVAFTSLVTVVIVSWLGQGTGVIVATAVGTLALLLLGEVIPKTMAVRNSERVAFIYATPLTWVEYLLLPFVETLHRLTEAINSITGGQDARGGYLITEAEVRTLIDIGEEQGTLEPAEAEMLEKVFHFGDRQVQEIMTPRTEIIWVSQGATLQDFLKTYSSETHTRFPVYHGNFENIVGIVSVKDLLKTMADSGLGPQASVTEVMRSAIFVPETKPVAELFSELRDTGQQMAIVVDQFGGVAGLVTLKQLIEVIVGRVGEEGSPATEEFAAVGEDMYEVDAGMAIQEANEGLGLGLPEGSYLTVAGFALDRLGHIPEQGEEFYFNDLRLEITEMRNLKIETVRIHRVKESAVEPN